MMRSALTLAAVGVALLVSQTALAQEPVPLSDYSAPSSRGDVHASLAT